MHTAVHLSRAGLVGSSLGKPVLHHIDNCCHNSTCSCTTWLQTFPFSCSGLLVCVSFSVKDQEGEEKKMAAGEEIGVGATEEGAGEITENREVVEKEENLEEVCKFFLEGRCRFGESCLNRHEGSPSLEAKERKAWKEEERRRRKKKEKGGEEKTKGKLPSMKTAADVISRLQWDKQMPVDKFTVGYIDRFIPQLFVTIDNCIFGRFRGVLEQPFTAFCWEDLASVDDYEVLFTPAFTDILNLSFFFAVIIIYFRYHFQIHFPHHIHFLCDSHSHFARILLPLF